MPADLDKDMSLMDACSCEDVHDAVRIGWACYLNYATAIVLCSFASAMPDAEGREGERQQGGVGTRLSPTVLGRLVQGMQCRQQLQDVVLPFIARCLKGPARGGVAGFSSRIHILYTYLFIFVNLLYISFVFSSALLQAQFSINSILQLM